MPTPKRESGVQSPRSRRVRAVLSRKEAAAYVGIEPEEFGAVRNKAGISWLRIPRCRPSTMLYRIADLDRYLAEETGKRWLPHERLGIQAKLGTWAAAYYLHLSSHQVRRLARLGEIPHEGGGQGVAYRFRVEDLNRCLEQWAGWG